MSAATLAAAYLNLRRRIKMESYDRTDMPHDPRCPCHPDQSPRGIVIPSECLCRDYAEMDHDRAIDAMIDAERERDLFDD